MHTVKVYVNHFWGSKLWQLASNPQCNSLSQLLSSVAVLQGENNMHTREKC